MATFMTMKRWDCECYHNFAYLSLSLFLLHSQQQHHQDDKEQHTCQPEARPVRAGHNDRAEQPSAQSERPALQEQPAFEAECCE